MISDILLCSRTFFRILYSREVFDFGRTLMSYSKALQNFTFVLFVLALARSIEYILFSFFPRRRVIKMNSVVLWMLCVSVVFTGVYSVGVDVVSVSVMEGDPVTLHTDVTTIQHETMMWYFNNTRIAQITGDLSFICTDVQCNEGTERIRDRLKVDHQTGSLTIMKTRITDSGDYILQIINTGSDSEKIFNVTVHDVSVADRDKMKGPSEEKGESGLSSAAVAGICVVLLIVGAAAAAVIYYRKRLQAGQRIRKHRSDQFCGTYSSVNLAEKGSKPAATAPSRNGNVNTIM